MNKAVISIFLSVLLLISTGVAQAARSNIDIEALVEAGLAIKETNFSDPAKKDEKSSEFNVARMELNFNARLSGTLSGHVSFLYQQDQGEEIGVDEIYLTLGDKQRGWHYSLGRMILPFGQLSSGMVTDPLTQKIAEIHETAFLAGYFQNGTYLSMYLFNGDTIKSTPPAIKSTSEDTAEHYGMSIGYASNNLTMGVDYISSMGDSDFLQGKLDNAAGSKAYIAGTSAYLRYTSKGMHFVMENIKSLDRFADSDFLNPPGLVIEPDIKHFELGFPSGSATYAIGYQTSSDAVGLLPEKRLMVSFGREIMKNALLSVEYSIEEDYSVASGGSGDEYDIIAMQLAVKF